VILFESYGPDRQTDTVDKVLYWPLKRSVNRPKADQNHYSIELRFYVPLDTKLSGQVIQFGDVPHWHGKIKPNTTKAHVHQSKEMYNNTKKLKPGLGLVGCVVQW